MGTPSLYLIIRNCGDYVILISGKAKQKWFCTETLHCLGTKSRNSAISTSFHMSIFLDFWVMEWLSIGLLSISILLGLLALVASGYVAMSLLKGKSEERDKAKRVYLLRSLPFLIAPARFFWSSFPHLKFAFLHFSFYRTRVRSLAMLVGWKFEVDA